MKEPDAVHWIAAELSSARHTAGYRRLQAWLAERKMRELCRPWTDGPDDGEWFGLEQLFKKSV